MRSSSKQASQKDLFPALALDGRTPADFLSGGRLCGKSCQQTKKKPGWMPGFLQPQLRQFDHNLSLVETVGVNKFRSSVNTVSFSFGRMAE